MTISATEAFDLTNPDLYALGDPFAVWQWLRRNEPVYWHSQSDGPGFWALTRHEDAVRVYKDPVSFSSARGIFLENYSRGEPAGGKMLALTDPPRHAKIRALFNRRLSARAVDELVPTMRVVARKSVADALERRVCDFVDTIAASLPLQIICSLIGVPYQDRDHVLSLSTRAFGGPNTKERSIGHQEILLYFGQLAAKRRQTPEDDLISVLVRDEIDGVQLTEEEVILNCNNLLIGGTENVRHAATGGMLAFIERPDQWSRLRTDPSLMTAAIEEILRWTTPALHLLRTATRDVQFQDKVVLKGEAVTVWNPSANRDEAIFATGEQFDVGRSPNRHLTFGVGEHFCIGASLGKWEIRVLFEELLRQVSSVELAGPVDRVRSITVFGIEHLPIEISS